MKNEKVKEEKGFTLVEMLISTALFAVIMVMAVGSLLSIIDASRQAQAKKTVVNNLHFALENMTRNIRTGSHFRCDASGVAPGVPLVARDCATAPATSFAFLTKDGTLTVYQYNTNAKSIERIEEGGEAIPITAPEVILNQMRFFVSGAGDGAEGAGQPRVLLVLDGVVQGRARVPSVFNIETLVSQRLLDIPL